MTASFSERHGYRQQARQLIYEDAPEAIRDGIVMLIRQLAPNSPHLYGIAEHIALYLGYPESVDSQFPEITLRKLVGAAPYGAEYAHWSQVYDLCEHTHQAFGPTRAQYQFADSLNALFKRYSISWEMRDGRLERRGDPNTDQVIQEARGLLGDERYQSVNVLFEKALGHRNKRPEPDWENCVKDAVLAVHAMVQTVEPKAKGSNFDADTNLLKDRIHPALSELLKKLNAYRGDAPRVAHPGDASKRVVEADAEFVLATSAAAIIYLSKI